MDYDLIIIGAGTAGFPSAAISNSYNKKILLLGDKPLGGKCISTGCIPTKALIYASNLYKQTLKAKNFGVRIREMHIDFREVFKYTQNLVNNIANKHEKRLKSLKNVTFIEKEGKCINETSVKVGNETYSGKNMLISTGTHPFIPPIEGIDEIDYLTHENLLKVQKKPESIAFIGGGFISVEFASFFKTLGCEVHIIESNPHLIHRADSTIISKMEDYFREDGIFFYTNMRADTVKKTPGNMKILKTNTGDIFEVEEIMISTGFVANTAGLGLEEAGVDLDNRGNIKVNEYLQTSVPNIWAMGDIIGRKQFTHMALREAKIVVHNIFSENKIPIHFENVPYAVFTDPTIGSIGKTEQELQEESVDYNTAIAKYVESWRGQIMKLNRGLIKMLYKDKKIYGCHIIGEGAENLVHEIVPLVQIPNGIDEFLKITHAHPTLSEIFTDIQKEIRQLQTKHRHKI